MTHHLAPAQRPTRTTTTPPPRSARLAAAGYFVLAVVGGVGTWYYNLRYSGGNYLGTGSPMPRARRPRSTSSSCCS